MLHICGLNTVLHMPVQLAYAFASAHEHGGDGGIRLVTGLTICSGKLGNGGGDTCVLSCVLVYLVI